MTTTYREGDRVRLPRDKNYVTPWRGAEVVVIDQDRVPAANPGYVRVRLEATGATCLVAGNDLTPVKLAPGVGVGDRVKITGPGRDFTGREGQVIEVVENNGNTVIRVRHDNGAVRGYNRDDLVKVDVNPVDYSADFPVGIMVRDTHGGAIGEVVDHRFESNVPVVQFPTGRAPFPDPVDRLERVHVLTHDELYALDDAIPVGGDKFQDRANEIIGKYLRPTVKHRFVVEIEQPASAKKMVDSGFLRAKLTSEDWTGFPVTVTEAAE